MTVNNSQNNIAQDGGKDSTASQSPGNSGVDMVRKAEQLARAVQFAQNAQTESDSFEDMGLLLVNDIRALIPFDRAFLVTFIGGETKLFSATGQTQVNPKAQLSERLIDMATDLKDLKRTLMISPKGQKVSLSVEGLEDKATEGISDYCAFSQCQHLVILPLKRGRDTIGVIVMEFMEDDPPDSVKVMALGTVGPFLALAFTEKWLAEACPNVAKKLNIQDADRARKSRFYKITLPILMICAILIIAILFLPKFTFHVGGEAEIVPTVRRVAFVQKTGIIKAVNVKEGAIVEKGRVLAILDPKELEFEIKRASRELEILTREMTLLGRSAGEDRSKIAESQLVRLKRENKLKELEFLKSRRKYLKVIAPVTGEVVTKDVEALTGKSFKAGEAFCEIAEKGRISAEVKVPEQRIGYVSNDMPIYVYLNTDPTNPIELKVEEIFPKAQVTSRLGAVFPVRSRISDPDAFLRVGMKGVGKIAVGERTLWFILTQRLITKWNQLTLHF